MKIYRIVFYLILFFGFSPVSAQKKITAEEYIDTYKNLAVSEMKRSGIPASITLAQGLLESGNGNSRLAVKANNHFGIKCHGWDGQEIYHDDNKAGECFRHYKSAKESYLDHTDFLMTKSRYAFLFEYKSTDYKNWAKGLRKAGYATEPKYPQLLINLIERYDLHQYDTGVKISKKASSGTTKPAATAAQTKNTGTKPKGKAQKTNDEFSITLNTHDVLENNSTEYILAKEGDTFESLSRSRTMMSWQLPKYNECKASTPLEEGQIVYLQPKRRKAAKGNDTHTVQQGETMHAISQKYAVKLSRLYLLNQMEEGTETRSRNQFESAEKEKDLIND